MTKELVSPWLGYPHIGLGSIGWRMGDGEDYWIQFDNLYGGLSGDQQAAYRTRYPEPTEVAQGLP